MMELNYSAKLNKGRSDNTNFEKFNYEQARNIRTSHVVHISEQEILFLKYFVKGWRW
jgi:hypothetical protein